MEEKLAQAIARIYDEAEELKVAIQTSPKNDWEAVEPPTTFILKFSHNKKPHALHVRPFHMVKATLIMEVFRGEIIETMKTQLFVCTATESLTVDSDISGTHLLTQEELLGYLESLLENL